MTSEESQNRLRLVSVHRPLEDIVYHLERNGCSSVVHNVDAPHFPIVVCLSEVYLGNKGGRLTGITRRIGIVSCRSVVCHGDVLNL